MTGSPGSRRRHLAIWPLAVLLAVAWLGGCDGGSGTEPADQQVTPSPAHSPSPGALAATATPLSTPSAAAPGDGQAVEVPEAGEPPSLEGLYSEDELEVARTMGDYYAWLMAHPDTEPELVENIFGEPRETGYRPTRQQIAREKVAQFQKHTWWWTAEEETRVAHVEVLDEQAPHVRIVRIYYHRPSKTRLMDSQGRVHEVLPPTRRFEEEIWVRTDRDSPWQTVSILNSGQWQEGDV